MKQNVALAVDFSVMREVTAHLAQAGITLGTPVRMVDRTRCYTATRPATKPIPHGWSDTDLTILRMLSEGLTHREIGDSLYIGHDTAKHRSMRLYRRLGARDRANAVLIALRMGLLETA